MTANDPTLAGLEAALRQAVRAGDATAESVARVNIACAHLQLESAQALPAFKEALSAVRRAQNPRSEAILSMAFAPYFLAKGDPGRALELAKRGEEIARKGRIGHRVLSHIQLARVLYTGFSDPDQAGEAVDRAVAALGEGEIVHPTDRQVVLEASGQAALAAVQAGDIPRALALMRIVDPAAAEKLEQQFRQPSAGLNASQRDELKRLYAQWRSRLEPGKGPDPRVATMAGKAADMMHWDKARARRSGSSGDADSILAFIERIHGVARGTQKMTAALTAPVGRMTDDDLVFALALATDPVYNTILPGWVVFPLAGAGAKDKALVGRCFRLAAAIGHQERDPSEILALLQRADSALKDGADDRLRAEVLIEIAVCQLNLRQPAPAMASALHAAKLARNSKDGQLERMARGNVANALLGLHKVREALEIFEALAVDQAAAGERDMAEISRQNIEGCRAFLRRQGEGV
jgi:hypothetical protein